MALDIRRYLPRRSIAAYVACFLAVAFQVALVALLIAVVSRHTSVTSTVAGIVWAAAAIHIVSCLSLPSVAYLSLRRSANLVQTVSIALAILLAILAALLSIYGFTQVWKTVHQHDTQDDSSATVHTLLKAGFAVWGLCVAAQGVFYAIVLGPTDVAKRDVESSGGETDRSTPVQSNKPSISIQMAVFGSPPRRPFGKTIGPSASSPFTDPSSPPSSVRHSLDNVLRPMASKTKLLLNRARDSYSLHSSRRPSLDTIGQEDDFGDWDTTGPNDIPQELYVRSPPRTRLEPIPGSRPVSPAKALEGPFHEEDDDRIRQESTANSQISLALAPIAPIYANSPPSETSSLRFSIRSLSSPHPDDEDIDPSKIHPLFRSDSPHPPPQHSTTTRIHGSRRAGEVWTDVPSSVPASGSIRLHSTPPGHPGHRAESPGPMTPARSRQGSVRSLRWAREDVPALPRSASALSGAREGFV